MPSAPQTVRFEEPDVAGDDPFTSPADVAGEETVPVGDGGGGGGGRRLVRVG